ncbi:AAA family ATPase, partial [Candidatus Woesearchaeota archaeon]|nr:AAA family ATPase [Candidatus Woesearchaeota archaeon]
MPLFDTSNIPGAQQPIAPESLDNIITNVYIPETLRQDLELVKTTINMSQKDANRIYGTLFKGPPGTGKTVLAKLVTKESGALFYNASKVNSEHLKRIFSEARKKAKEGNKVVIFIDEIDGLGMERSAALMNVGESKESLHVLLTELSEKEKNKGITVIAATNKPEILDPALMRPERLGFNIDFPVPNYKDRVEIMKVVSKLPQDVVKSIANKTQGYTPADLVHVISLANTFREHNKRSKIDEEDIQFALRKSSPSGLAGLLSYEPKITLEDVIGKDVMKKVITSVLKTSPAADYF